MYKILFKLPRGRWVKIDAGNDLLTSKLDNNKTVLLCDIVHQTFFGGASAAFSLDHSSLTHSGPW